MERTQAAADLAFDRHHLWHPYTSLTDPTPARIVTAASGATLTLIDPATQGERTVVDAMSSWWAAVHGYRHPVLDAALHAQVETFSHVMFGGLTHAPAVELGRRLVAITPAPLDAVFLADSGSVAVEVALKVVVQAQRGRGRPERTRMLTVLGGYHGDTLDAMSVTDPVAGMHAAWRDLLPQQVFAPRPPRAAATDDEVQQWADAVRDLAAKHTDQLAGIVVEPLLQGAGGMWPYPPACLRVLREVADEHGLLLVFDEIATGFGRTGHLFVSELVTPDVLCVGKALTGGQMTLSAVLTTREVATSVDGPLMHGPTFMGNPLACAVACASIDLLLAETGDGPAWQVAVGRINAALTRGLEPLRGLPGVRDVRTLGAVGVVQLEAPVDVVAATDAAIAAGVWLRPFGDLVYVMPPYVTDEEQLRTVVAGVEAAVRASVAAVGVAA